MALDIATPGPDAPPSHGALNRGQLSDAQRADYAERGWTAAPSFFSAAEAAEIARWTDALAARPEVAGAHMVYWETSVLDPARKVRQRIEDFCPIHAGFDALVHGRLADATAELMGGPVVLFKDKINFKEPGGAGFEPHQDQQAGWGVYAPLFVTALVSIDRSTLENGCLEMAQTQRLSGLVGEEWKPMTADEIGPLTPVPSEPGDVLFFDSFAPHASKPNLTDAARRILYITYNLAAEGDHRRQYFADKRASFPPDVEREPGREYRFRV
jgi:hypothetical protein